MIKPSFFERRKGWRMMLSEQRSFTSLMATDHPDRVRLVAYLDETLEAAQRRE